MYLKKTPFWLRIFYPKSVLWSLPQKEPTIYLTFDDGPIPTLTPEILKILREHNVKATFFCVGDNIRKYKEIYKQIADEGHLIGNHTFNHLNSWKTYRRNYLRNILLSQKQHPSVFFRPPYGRISPWLAYKLGKRFSVVLWSVLSGDFDSKTTKEECLQNVIEHTTNGSIVVFHDNIKAKEKVLYALPRFIAHFKGKGYKFSILKRIDFAQT